MTNRSKYRIAFFPMLGLLLCMTVPSQRCKSDVEQVKKADSAAVRVAELGTKAARSQSSGDNRAALEYHYRARSESRKAHLREQEARSLVAIARLIRSDSAKKSLAHLYDALAIATEIGHARLRADIYLAISETHKSQLNYKAALQALEVHHQLVDSLMVREKGREEASMKADSRNKLERTIGISVAASAFCIAVVLWLYSRRMRRLNVELLGLNKVKDQLFSVIGHDLRGPSGSLVQAFDLFDPDLGADKADNELLLMMRGQASSLFDTIETLFHWASAQQQGGVVNASEFSAGPRVDHSLELLHGQAFQKGIVLENALGGEIRVSCDVDHFKLIIRNLVSNAIKFSESGGSIAVGCKTEGKMALFSVSDQGRGMDPQALGKFGTWEMGSSFGTAGEKGSGLGLQMVAKLIDANGGRLWAQSELGTGTTVFFSVPLGSQQV